MKRPDEPTVISLESARRRRQAEARRKPARAPNVRRPAASEPAINWRRAPLFIALVLAFLALSWLIRQAGALSPFH